MLSTSEHVSSVCSALQIDFGCNKLQCSWGSSKQVSCHNVSDIRDLFKTISAKGNIRKAAGRQKPI